MAVELVGWLRWLRGAALRQSADDADPAFLACCSSRRAAEHSSFAMTEDANRVERARDRTTTTTGAASTESRTAAGRVSVGHLSSRGSGRKAVSSRAKVVVGWPRHGVGLD